MSSAAKSRRTARLSAALPFGLAPLRDASPLSVIAEEFGAARRFQVLPIPQSRCQAWFLLATVPAHYHPYRSGKFSPERGQVQPSASELDLWPWVLEVNGSPVLL